MIHGFSFYFYRFLRKCRDASVKDKQVQRYMDILLSSVEYNTFVQLMKLMRPVALHRLQVQEAESKSSAVGGGDGKHSGSSSPSKASKEVYNDDDRADAKDADDYASDSKGTDKMSK
jgi:hypothetical protein